MLVAKMLQGRASKEAKRLLTYMFANSRGGPIRIKIVSLLRRKPLNINQLSNALGMDYHTIQHHMTVLEKNNLASRHSVGYGTTYLITPLLESNMEAFDEIFSMLLRIKN